MTTEKYRIVIKPGQFPFRRKKNKPNGRDNFCSFCSATKNVIKRCIFTLCPANKRRSVKSTLRAARAPLNRHLRRFCRLALNEPPHHEPDCVCFACTYLVPSPYFDEIKGGQE